MPSPDQSAQDWPAAMKAWHPDGGPEALRPGLHVRRACLTTRVRPDNRYQSGRIDPAGEVSNRLSDCLGLLGKERVARVGDHDNGDPVPNHRLENAREPAGRDGIVLGLQIQDRRFTRGEVVVDGRVFARVGFHVVDVFVPAAEPNGGSARVSSGPPDYAA